jgi:DNA-binding response OmpR family regulator
MSGEKIVIIDDDPEICDAMSEILSEYDYQVSTALDTQTGYQLLLEQRPDLLILDIMMATMHEGLDFATKIKEREGVYGMPVLIVSARPPVEKGYGRTLEELIHNVELLLKK